LKYGSVDWWLPLILGPPGRKFLAKVKISSCPNVGESSLLRGFKCAASK